MTKLVVHALLGMFVPTCCLTAKKPLLSIEYVLRVQYNGEVGGMIQAKMSDCSKAEAYGCRIRVDSMGCDTGSPCEVVTIVYRAAAEPNKVVMTFRGSGEKEYEPPRVYRRRVDLSYATKAGHSSEA